MAVNLPPFPANAQPGGFVWTDWWKKFQDYIKEVTKVAGEGSSPTFGSFSTDDIKWTVVANYLLFHTRIPRGAGGPISIPGGQIDCGSSSEPMPNPERPGVVEFTAYNDAPLAANCGNGLIINGDWTYGPTIVVPAIEVPSGDWESIYLQGWYFVS